MRGYGGQGKSEGVNVKEVVLNRVRGGGPFWSSQVKLVEVNSDWSPHG